MLGQQPKDEAIIHGDKKMERKRTKGNTNFRFGKTGKRKGKRKLLGLKDMEILKFNPSQQLFSSICGAVI